MLYIHFTDIVGARGIRESSELWACSFVTGVYAAWAGGLHSEGVQLTKLGRAATRKVAVVFETDVRPDVKYPEEVIWHADKIPVRVVKTIFGERAVREYLLSREEFYKLHPEAEDSFESMDIE